MEISRFIGAVMMLTVLGRVAAAQDNDVLTHGDSAPPRAAKAAASALAMSVKTSKKTFKPEETIVFTLLIRDTLKNRPVTLQFASAKKFDVAVRRKSKPGDREIWRWSRDKMFAMVITTLTVSPEKPATFTVKFDPVREKLAPLTPGSYAVTATLTPLGAAPQSAAEEEFTVRK